MKKISWITGALIALLGLLVVIFPIFWLKVVVIVLGLGSIGYGIYNLKVTRSIYENSSYEKTILVKSLINIIMGILAVILPVTIAGTMWTIMVYILAVYLIVTAVLGFYAVSLLKDSGIDRNRYVFENLGLLIGAVFLFLIPTKSLGTFIIRLLGILIAVLGIIILVIDITSQKNTLQAEVVSDEDGNKVEAIVKKFKLKSKNTTSKNDKNDNDSDDTIVAESIITQESSE